MRIHQRIPETTGRVPTPDGRAQVMELPSDAPRFPAVVDTGNNHNFAIRQDQLARWTGLTLPKRGLINVGGTTIPLHAANVWIHPDSGDPFRLRMEENIGIYPPDVANPARLPILGLRGWSGTA